MEAGAVIQIVVTSEGGNYTAAPVVEIDPPWKLCDGEPGFRAGALYERNTAYGNADERILDGAARGDTR